MRKINLFIIFLLAMSAVAQPIVSPEVTADGSVTFRYSHPKAVTVRVRSDCLLRKPDNSWFGGKMGTAKMHRDSAGVWELTTPPLAPELYQYRFIVNGIYRHDPLNRDSAYVLLHQESIVAVGGNPQADLYVEPAAGTLRGHLDTLDCYDEEQQVTRRMVVYVPPVAVTENLPVVWLLHGISGDERVWTESGRAFQILDNLLAAGDIRPMLVVMPDCNVISKISPKKRTNLLRNMFCYPALQMGDFEKAFPRMHDFLMQHYGLTTDAGHRAIAGLSSGAKQAANIVRDNPGLFSVVGLFSPVLGKKQLPEATDSARYMVAVGRNDLFYKKGLRFARRLDKTGASYVLYESEGGHTWRSWRVYLTEFLISLFREESAGSVTE